MTSTDDSGPKRTKDPATRDNLSRRPRRSADRVVEHEFLGEKLDSAPADPRICRICGERALDMKYHLQRVHPRGANGPGTRQRISLNPAANDAVREMLALLSEARDGVFAEPLRTTNLIDRAREWLGWLQDRSKPHPAGRLPSTSFGAASSDKASSGDKASSAPRRRVMHAPSGGRGK